MLRCSGLVFTRYTLSIPNEREVSTGAEPIQHGGKIARLETLQMYLIKIHLQVVVCKSLDMIVLNTEVNLLS